MSYIYIYLCLLQGWLWKVMNNKILFICVRRWKVTGTVKPVLCDIPREYWNRVIQWSLKYRFNLYEVHCEWKLKFKSHNISYCKMDVVTKAGLIVLLMIIYISWLPVLYTVICKYIFVTFPSLWKDNNKTYNCLPTHIKLPLPQGFPIKYL